MKLYVKSSMSCKFIPKSGKTDYRTLKYAFDFLEEGDFMLDDEGNIYFVVDAGELRAGFLEGYRIIEVEAVNFNQLPDAVKDAIYYLANSYPSSSICRKVLQQG